MTINSLKELNKLIALCRKTGVQSIKIDGIEMHLGAMPTKAIVRQIDTNVFPEESIKVPMYNPGNTSEDKIEEETLTEEQLLYYSARPETPEQDQ